MFAVEARCWSRSFCGVALLCSFLSSRGDDLAVSTVFESEIQPLLKKYCVPCHNADKMKSGVRVDHLSGDVPEGDIRLWEVVHDLVAEGEMPPEGEAQPTADERRRIDVWIAAALHMARSREVARNGSVRRLTVDQYRNTIHELLGLEDDLTDTLPPEAVSRDGFINNSDSMLLSPLLLESYFEIADEALNRSLVDVEQRPVIQKFRMELGRGINPDPVPEELILGAASVLLRNEDFVVSELTPRKGFPFIPFRMKTKYRFVEGYRGNSTVRGWREYDSIYHAVYACMRGSGGYPLGNPYDLVPEGLLLRPAIPSAELFQVESTYGPKANFKVALRELPDHGRFRVTVQAAKYDDGLLLDGKVDAIGHGLVAHRPAERPQTVQVDEAGVYQVEIYREPPPGGDVVMDDSQLGEGHLKTWSFDDGQVVSPFGRALGVEAAADAVVVSPDAVASVGRGDFTIAAWIRPSELRQGGIVASGPYGRQGWVFDTPGKRGVLRLQTHRGYEQGSGTVQSRSGLLRSGDWQHVAAIVRRGKAGTRLYVNGYEVASGNVASADLSHPDFGLHIGRVPQGDHFEGEIDEVQLFSRALDMAELQVLIQPGRDLVQPPPDGRQPVTLRLGDHYFSGSLQNEPFVVVRLPVGSVEVSVSYGGAWAISRVVLAPLGDAKAFQRFEQQSPLLGVHFGLRRDCGHTLNPVQSAVSVESRQLQEFVFEGAINNYPSPDVEENNVNYISGLREIGVRSEYTDGRDRPRLLVRSIEFEGPLYDTWPPQSHRRIMTSDDPYKVIGDFATRAFRRPVNEEERARLRQVFDASLARGRNQRDSLRDVLLVILTSPQFLFLIEESEGPEPEDLDGYELASKLAYFLWNGPPDGILLDLALSDALDGSLDEQLDRMIEDERFKHFTEAFVTQWLGLEKLESVETDRERYPRLTRDAKQQLQQEPVRFLEYLIRANLPLRHLVKSEWLVVNEVAADYYDMGERVESGFGYRPIRHDDPNLGGLLTQAGLLAALSDGREAHPIKRGAWLARKIIGEPPADPPPNVPDLSEENAHLPLREQLERHRNQEGCAKCHQGIDPWGFPFQTFNAGGRFDGEKAMDTRSLLPDTTEVANVNELKRYLAEDRLDQVAFSFLRHLTTYAVGRNLTYNEIEFLRQTAVDWNSSDYRMRDLLRFVIHSEVFLKK